MTSMQQWREVYVQKECLAAVRCYLNWKKIFGEADLEFAALDQSQLQVLARLHCSEEDRPTLRDEVHEKMTTWLTALPGNVRKNVEEKVLVTTWKKDHFFDTLVEFFKLKKHIPVDEDAAETGEVPSSQKRKRWLPLKKKKWPIHCGQPLLQTR